MLSPETPSPLSALTQVEIDYQNAKMALIDESMHRPVLVDFWADWCGPCKSLSPLLDKLATDYAGAFLLAKVNVDQLPQLASQFGIQSLPTLMMMQQGQPVDGLQGLQTEVALRDWIDRFLPAPWEAGLREGEAALAAGDLQTALPLLKEAYTLSDKTAPVALVYTEALLAFKRLDEAEQVLAAIRKVDQNADYDQLKAQLELLRQAGKAPEITELEAALADDSDNLSLKLALASQYAAHQYFAEALALLWPVLDKDLQAEAGEVKRVFMDLLTSLGKKDPLAIRYTRMLYAKLY
jgi:putative thioredoxin